MKRKTRERVAFLLSLFFHALILLFFLNKNVNEKIFTPPSLGKKEVPRISLRNFSLLETKQNENSAPSPLIANNLAQEPIISQNPIESKIESKIKNIPQKSQDSIKPKIQKPQNTPIVPPKPKVIKSTPPKEQKEPKQEPKIQAQQTTQPPQNQKILDLIESKRQEAARLNKQRKQESQKPKAIESTPPKELKQESKEPQKTQEPQILAQNIKEITKEQTPKIPQESPKVPQDSIKKDLIESKQDLIESTPPKELKQELQAPKQEPKEPQILAQSLKEQQTPKTQQEPPRQIAKAQLPRYANVPLLAPSMQDLAPSTPSNGDGTLIRAAREIYGESFESLSQSERKFIENNLQNIGKITQRYLRYPRTAGRLGQSGDNIVEFYLHPNGDISELKLISESGYSMLDENSIHTIRLAYKDYPYPSERTLIRIRVFYFLR